jgi:orotidine 5'-phosphate decarboxylase subfamily 2
MNFKEKLKKIVSKNDSLLCVGLDIDKERMPKHIFKDSKTPYLDFNREIIESTMDLVCAYKLNMAFYEVLGIEGIKILKNTIELIPRDIAVILDGKRNDIGNTARKYAKSLFETYNADSVTINPYLGKDGIEPFLEYKDKFSFILCRTSNPSAIDIQDVKISGKPLYELVAEKINEWNTFGNCGAVVGATYPNELESIRKILGDDTPILIPGIGAQGGDVEKTIKYGTNKNKENAIINSSRGILYASTDKNFSNASRKEAILLKDKINRYR